MNGATSKPEDEGEQNEGGEENRGPTDLDGPDSDESLYETYGSEDDDPLRPIFQGDVFSGITLAGYEQSDHDAVMLVGHPCSLRDGATLRERMQAVPVRTHHRVPPRRWPTGEKQCFPLPALEGGEARRALLTESGLVTRDQLRRAHRVAALSRRGILLLQQRIVWTFARTVVRLDTFAEHNEPQLIELELLEYWNEQACAGCSPNELADALKATARQFEQHMIDSDWRKLLQQPERRAEARKAIREEADRQRRQS